MATGFERLADFGIRSLVLHGLMAVGFVGAAVSALLIDGRVGLLSFIAFVNFTAGLWIAQSVHSLGNSYAGSDYDGVIAVLRDL